MAYAPASLPSLSLVFFAADNTSGNPAPLPSLAFMLGSSSNKAVTAAAGAYALTGKNAGLNSGRKFTAAAGSFSLTGISASLGRNVVVTNSGSGNPASLPHLGLNLDHDSNNKFISATSGGFTILAQTASLARGHQFSVAAGAFLWSGAPALSDYEITAVKGAFSVTGNAAVLSGSNNGITARPGAFTITGNGAFLTPAVAGATVFPAFSGTFTLTGYPAGFARTRVLQCATGAFIINGQTVFFDTGGGREGIWELVSRAHTNWT